MIKLTQGKSCIIDKDDLKFLEGCRLWANKRRDNYYVVVVYNVNGKVAKKDIHRFLLNPDVGMVVDHINSNGLDNRRVNLRVCTNKENCRNRRALKNKSSSYKGVSWNKNAQKWTAQIVVNARRIHLGSFADEIAAAKAYNEKALTYFKSFANLNKVG